MEDKQQGHQLWYRFADRTIRSEKYDYTTLNYIHYNSVKHKKDSVKQEVNIDPMKSGDLLDNE